MKRKIFPWIFVIYNTLVLPEPIPVLSYISQGGYFVLFGYYIWQFFREYRNYKRRVDNFYAGNERLLFRWLRDIYIIVIVIGILAGVIVENNIWFLLFIALYTVTYVYLAIRYINYPTLFSRIAPVVASTIQPPNGKDVSEAYIRPAIDRWISDKEFLTLGVSLDSLSQQLGTNPAYLSRVINMEYGQNFRSWVNSLRIAEAQKLLVEYEELSFDEIGERVGIPSSSTFYRHFASVTGMSPAQYRRQFGNGNNTP